MEITINNGIASKTYPVTSEQLIAIQSIFEKEKKNVNLDTVFSIVKLYCREKNMSSQSRKAALVYPRFLFCYAARETTRAPLMEIANKVCRKDHTTVIHACAAIRKQMDTDEYVKRDVENIICLISGFEAPEKTVQATFHITKSKRSKSIALIPDAPKKQIQRPPAIYTNQSEWQRFVNTGS